jgi:hypothetical protein
MDGGAPTRLKEPFGCRSRSACVFTRPPRADWAWRRECASASGSQRV